MKMIPLSMVLAMSGLLAATPLRAETSPPAPSLNAVKEIALHGLDGVTLRIFRDGSGALVDGQKNESRLPVNTFAFARIYKMLTPRLVSGDNETGDVAAPSVEDSYGHNYHFLINDQKIIEHLLSDAGVKMIRR